MPSIYKPRLEKVYRAKVGYVMAATGKRVRREFRLGDDPVIATKKALWLAEKWLKEEQRHHRMRSIDRDTFPADELIDGPVWTGMPDVELDGREAYLATPPEDLPGDEVAISMRPGKTLQDASKALYERLKAKADRDAKAYGTLWWYEQHLRLGLITDALNPQLPICEITIEHVERYCDYWCDLQARAKQAKGGSFGWQTACNRLDAFAYLLRDQRGRVPGFVYPERADAVFAENKQTVAGDLTAIPMYAPDQIKAIFKKGNDRVRLTVYLALNFGMLQADIGQQLRRRHVEEHGGILEVGSNTFVQWHRHKLKRKQRALRRDGEDREKRVLLTHYVWPETLALLKRFAAAEGNPFNLWLLNEDGMPMWQHKPDQKRPLDCISTAYYRASRLAKVQLPFDSFRKFGATACESLSTMEVQEMYRGERRKGSSRVYVLQDFIGKLTPFLQTWAERLRADGVLH